MLSHASLSGGFWAEAFKTAVHVINRSPNKNLDHGIPKEAWSGKKPQKKTSPPFFSFYFSPSFLMADINSILS